MKTIAVVGTGIMGNGIASNYLKNKYTVFVWNRNKNKLKPLLEKGAIEVESPKEAAEKADMVFEVTANDESSRQVWLGEKGIISGASKKSILIASATLSVEWIDELAEISNKKNISFFDIPMTGGRAGAEAGKLIFLAGGNEKKLNLVKRDLSPVSEKVLYFGKEGSGARFKLLLNSLQAIHLQGLGEILGVASEMGMNLKKVGDSLSDRPGGTTTTLAWRDYQKEPNPINFSVEWITKDLIYTKKAIKKTKTPLLDKTLIKYQLAMKKKMGQKDWTSVNKIK